MTIAIITEAGVRKVAPLVVSAQQAAAAAQTYAAIASAAAQGPIYASYAAGNSATTAGQYFFVASGGAYELYIHGTATPIVKMPTLDVSTGNLLVSALLGIGTTSPHKQVVVSDNGAEGFEIEAREGNYIRLLAYDRVANGYIPVFLEASRIIFLIASVPNYADDTAAGAGGIAVGGLYRTGSAVKIRAA